MTPEQFCYWLQGYMELTDEVVENHSLTFEQVLVIKEHLNKVFNNSPQKYMNYEHANLTLTPPPQFINSDGQQFYGSC